MRICELRQKQVINICDCQILGCACDVDINMCTGRIEAIIVPGPCRLWGVIGRDTEYVIPFRCIKQVGPDVILVDVNVEEILVKCTF